jgi:uncharacterized RDD family membrane protein YckC
MDDLSPPSRWHDPPLPPPPRVGFTAHVGGAFADSLFSFGLLLLASATFIVLETYVLPSAVRQSWLLTQLMPGALVAAYVMTEAVFATSPGKWLVSLTVRAADGRRASRSRLLARCALKYAPLLILAADFVQRSIAAWLRDAELPSIWEPSPVAMAAAKFAYCFVLLGGLLCLLPARQTLHDLIAGTALFLDSDLPHYGDDAPIARGFEVRAPSPPPAPAPVLEDAPP